MLVKGAPDHNERTILGYIFDTEIDDFCDIES